MRKNSKLKRLLAITCAFVVVFSTFAQVFALESPDVSIDSLGTNLESEEDDSLVILDEGTDDEDSVEDETFKKDESDKATEETEVEESEEVKDVEKEDTTVEEPVEGIEEDEVSDGEILSAEDVDFDMSGESFNRLDFNYFHSMPKLLADEDPNTLDVDIRKRAEWEDKTDGDAKLTLQYSSNSGSFQGTPDMNIVLIQDKSGSMDSNFGYNIEVTRQGWNTTPSQTAEFPANGYYAENNVVYAMREKVSDIAAEGEEAYFRRMVYNANYPSYQSNGYLHNGEMFMNSPCQISSHYYFTTSAKDGFPAFSMVNGANIYNIDDTDLHHYILLSSQSVALSYQQQGRRVVEVNQGAFYDADGDPTYVSSAYPRYFLDVTKLCNHGDGWILSTCGHLNNDAQSDTCGLNDRLTKSQDFVGSLVDELMSLNSDSEIAYVPFWADVPKDSNNDGVGEWSNYTGNSSNNGVVTTSGITQKNGVYSIDFTSDKTVLKNQIGNNFTYQGTNWANAFKATKDLIANKDNGKETLVIFLTDGVPQGFAGKSEDVDNPEISGMDTADKDGDGVTAEGVLYDLKALDGVTILACGVGISRSDESIVDRLEIVDSFNNPQYVRYNDDFDTLKSNVIQIINDKFVGEIYGTGAYYVDTLSGNFELDESKLDSTWYVVNSASSYTTASRKLGVPSTVYTYTTSRGYEKVYVRDTKTIYWYIGDLDDGGYDDTGHTITVPLKYNYYNEHTCTSSTGTTGADKKLAANTSQKITYIETYTNSNLEDSDLKTVEIDIPQIVFKRNRVSVPIYKYLRQGTSSSYSSLKANSNQTYRFAYSKTRYSGGQVVSNPLGTFNITVPSGSSSSSYTLYLAEAGTYYIHEVDASNRVVNNTVQSVTVTLTPVITTKAHSSTYPYSITKSDENSVSNQNNHLGITASKNVTSVSFYNYYSNLSGTKTWSDNNNSLGLRPDTYTVILYRNGEYLKEQSFDSDSNWSFTGLETYSPTGEKYTYTIDEPSISVGQGYSYVPTIDGYDITNTLSNSETVKIEGTKVWDDNNNSSGNRPQEVTINLLRDGIKIASTKTNASKNWKYSFDGLIKYNSEYNEYVYSIEEEEVENYETSYEEKEPGVRLTFSDDSATENIRYDYVQVIYKKDGKYYEAAKIGGNATNTNTIAGAVVDVPTKDFYLYWKTDTSVNSYYGFKIDNIEAIYGDIPEGTSVSLPNASVIETDTLPESPHNNYNNNTAELYHYDSGFSKGYNIINTYAEKVEISGVKVWKDSGYESSRPTWIGVTLNRNGSSYKSMTVTADNNWEFSFGEVDKYDSEGNLYEYTISESVYMLDGTKYDLDVTMEEESGKYIFTMTNTRIVEKIKIEGVKEWDDAGYESSRPTWIGVTLNRNGSSYKSMTVTADDNWEFDFGEVEKYDTNGELYEYTISESVYMLDNTKYNLNVTMKEESGKYIFTMTNTRIVEKIKIEGIKKWVDEGYESQRPNWIGVSLLRNGSIYSSMTVTASDNWEFDFGEVEKYDNNGNLYEYTISESVYGLNASNYDLEVSMRQESGKYIFTMVNTRIVEKVNLWGIKLWEDEGFESKRPSSVTVALLQNGVEVDTKVVSEDTDWEYFFGEYPKYDLNYDEYEYSVIEKNLNSKYVSKVEDKGSYFQITNTYVGSTTLWVIKFWEDDGYESERPENIMVGLLRNGEEIATAELSEDTDWEYYFSNYPEYDLEGNKYTYSVVEKNVDENYISSIKVTSGAFEITNTYIEKVNLWGYKFWEDDGYEDRRPETITVALLQDGVEVATAEVSEDTDWSYFFGYYPKISNEGVEYTYTVVEKDLSDSYDSSVVYVEGNSPHFEITNTYIAEEVDLWGIKTWNDKDFESSRPKNVTVALLQNNVEVATKSVSANTDWEYHFGKYPKYDSNGVEYKYTVKEKNLDQNYNSEVKDKGDHFEIINTYIGNISFWIVKVWEDEGHEYERPRDVTIALLRDGEEVATDIVNVYTDWECYFDNYPECAPDGTKYNYTVVEKDVDDNYISTIVDYGDGSFDVVNTYVEKLNLWGYKFWEDEGNEDKRPESITVALLQDGVEVDEVEVSEDTDWEFHFGEYPSVGQDGIEHTYTVVEKDLDENYMSEITYVGNQSPHFEITNKYLEKFTISGKKVWDDGGFESSRPSTIGVTLHRNGQVYKTIAVNDSNNWEFDFGELNKFDENGKEYEYTVSEDVQSNSNRYDVSISKEVINGGYYYTITNSYKTGLVTVIKEISVDTIWWDHGNPTFIIKLSGTTSEGYECSYSHTFEFTKEYVEDNKNGNFVTLEHTFKVPYGSSYKIEEVKVSRYNLESLKIEGQGFAYWIATNNPTPGYYDKYGNFTVSDSNKEWVATFTNKPSNYSLGGDNAVIVNKVDW